MCDSTRIVIGLRVKLRPIRGRGSGLLFQADETDDASRPCRSLATSVPQSDTMPGGSERSRAVGPSVPNGEGDAPRGPSTSPNRPNGAAPESNRPSVGLPHRTGLEDPLGTPQARFATRSRGDLLVRPHDRPRPRRPPGSAPGRCRIAVLRGVPSAPNIDQEPRHSKRLPRRLWGQPARRTEPAPRAASSSEVRLGCPAGCRYQPDVYVTPCWNRRPASERESRR